MMSRNTFPEPQPDSASYVSSGQPIHIYPIKNRACPTPAASADASRLC